MLDDEQRYRAIVAKDPRFDGMFVTGVTSTGIYCRPSCPAITPRRDRLRFFPSAAAAQRAGFRACKRCRPDAAPGSPEWSVRADVTARAVRLIRDGVIERDGVTGLATHLGYEQRQLRRLLTAELGAGPLAIARAQRAQTARTLIETTSLHMGDIAFAAGFTSIRQFNATIQEAFAVAPGELRSRNRGQPLAPAGAPVVLRLPYRPPLDLGRMLRFLASRAIPGVEAGTAQEYRRALTLPHGQGIMTITAGQPGWLRCELILADLRDLTTAVRRCRQLFDLDADPEPIAAVLAPDPLLGPLVAGCPGRRSPGCADEAEQALRAVLGQQVSVAAARTLGARLAERYGQPLELAGHDPADGLTRCFPAAGALAQADPAGLPVPAARARALTGLATELAAGRLVLDGGADRDEVTARLLGIGGIGQWTAAYVRMRALADPDAFPGGDAGVLAAFRSLGGTGPAELQRLSRRWRPWRSYATHHLWAYLEREKTS